MKMKLSVIYLYGRHSNTSGSSSCSGMRNCIDRFTPRKELSGLGLDCTDGHLL